MNITTNTVYIPHETFLKFWEPSLFSVFSEKEDIFETFEPENIKNILKLGACVNEVEKEYGMNFLQKCILEDFSLNNTEGEIFREIIDLLIAAHIDLDHQDFDGCTALHLAVEKEQWDLVKLLLENGANPALVDCEGNQAFL